MAEVFREPAMPAGDEPPPAGSGRGERRPRRRAAASAETIERPEAGPAITDDVARRAYELFEQRGGGHGQDWEDWFQAERELRPPASAGNEGEGRPRRSRRS